MKLSIVIPAYNEEARLGPTMDAYLAYFTERYGDEVEFVIVVNGSMDRTEAISNAYATERTHVRTLVEPRAIGKGGAIMLGFRNACGDAVGFVDADGATPPEAFDDLVKALAEADAVIASRRLPGSRVWPRQPWRRRVASRVFNGWVRLLFDLPITDTQCGAKLLRAEAARAVLPHLGLTRWAFDVDLLFQLRREGFRLIERPTVWHDRAGSKIRIGKTSFEMFVAVCRLRLLYSPLRGVVGLYDRTLGRIIHLREETGRLTR